MIGDVEWKLRGGEDGTRDVVVPLVAGSSYLKKKKKGLGLPGEGVLYDRIHYSKLWDRSTRRVSLGLTKTFRTDLLSDFLDRKVPTVFDISCEQDGKMKQGKRWTERGAR